MSSSSGMGITKTSTADFNQWLHAMRMVVRLPGEVPPEFRKKLWVSLADRYLHIKRLNWEKESVRCLSEQWKSDDQELADQINKDLHRTGSSFCSGTVNQAKLKRVLVGYSRWNKEVGYCQGFNMLGALILQVVDTDEASTIKIMIYLIEGVLPPGYFCGALTGLQADMGVFRELLATRLPRLSQHLQKLQGHTGEGLEPPLINVFTMQWFLTLFCTCLPFACVLRVWDLILTDGGDVLLRTALALWELLEQHILATRTADDFYSQMGDLSGALLNGTLMETNELVQRVVAMGPIQGLHKLRDKHLNNIAQWKDKRKLRLFYSDDDAESDDDSKVAMATIWGLRLNRRGSASSNKGGASPSSSASAAATSSSTSDREKIALDINLLKQQYGKLRERQKQAQIILTAACVRQTMAATASTSSASSSPAITLNSLLAGRTAITSNKGRRPGAPLGTIPPARNASGGGKAKGGLKSQKSLPAETLHWKDTENGSRLQRRDSLKWKDIKKVDGVDGDSEPGGKSEEGSPGGSRGESVANGMGLGPGTAPSRAAKSRAKFTSRNRSESSSYSEDSDSSSSTSLCDDDNVNVVKDSGSSIESSPFKRNDKDDASKVPIKEKIMDITNRIESLDKGDVDVDKEADVVTSLTGNPQSETAENTLEIQVDFVEPRIEFVEDGNAETIRERGAGDGVIEEDLPITSTSQLSPVGDFSQYLNVSIISPLKTPASPFDLSEMLTNNTLSPSPTEPHEATLTNISDGILNESINEDGVTNAYFERINSVERPSRLELTEGDSDDGRRTFERNSTLSIPTYEIIDVDDMEEADDVDGVLLIGRSSSMNVLQNSTVTVGGKLKGNSNAADPFTATMRTGAEARLPGRGSLAGKSSSLDDTKRPVLMKSNPVSSWSETIDSARDSEKALEIIQENSKILHRILRKSGTREEDLQEEKENGEIETTIVTQKESVSSPDLSPCPPPTSSQSPIKSDVPETVATIQADDALSSPFPASSSETKLSVTTSQERRPVPAPQPPPAAAKTITDTLSSIENTIKSINSLCQEHELFGRMTRNRLMENIEEIINSGNAIKVQIDTSDDITKKLNPSSRSPSLSPIREHGVSNGVVPESPIKSSLSTGDYRSWNRASNENKELPGLSAKLDKSPSSPVITRSYLDSLKASSPLSPPDTDRVSRRIIKSAENSPSHSFSRKIVESLNDSDYDFLQSQRDTKDLLDKYLNRDKGQCATTTAVSMNLIDSNGIEPRKHKSLEFDAI